MADNEQKAMQLIAEAEKKLTSSKGFLGSLFGFVFSTFLFVDSSICTAKSGKLQLFFLSLACACFLFCSKLFSLLPSQAVAPTKLRMLSRATIELRTCLRWPRSGSKLEVLSYRLQTCMHKLRVATMPLPTTSMLRTATRR